MPVHFSLQLPKNLPQRTAPVWIALGVVLLQACSSSPRTPAPVEERSTMVRPATTVAASNKPVDSSAPATVKPLPGAENAGKPGYYTVKPGDTLIRVGLETGQSWKDLARWNQLENPNLIEVGQVLRIIAPQAAAEPSGVVVKPVLPPGASGTTPTGNASAPAASATTPAANPGKPAVPTNSLASGVSAADDLAFVWPANGSILAGFDEAKNKGIDIAGKVGDPVYAAADGQVVYAGSGLRGYGNLIILKHNKTYLSAYAHNQVLLVKEDQTVRKGQKIAEMGNVDADRVKLHFEIRRQGKPTDPLKLLPAR